MVTVSGREIADVGKDTDNVTDNVTDRSSILILLIKKNNRISTAEIASKLNVTKRTIVRDINLLKNNGLLKRIGSEKGGYWEVTEGPETLKP